MEQDDLLIDGASGLPDRSKGRRNEVAMPAESEARAFERLHALVRKGYHAEIGPESAGNLIVLRHLGKAPDLVLHPDGTVEPLEGRRPRHKRALEYPKSIKAAKDADQIRFMKFLETVPKPSLRDRTRPWRRKYIYIPVMLLIFWGLMLMFTVIVANLTG